MEQSVFYLVVLLAVIAGFYVIKKIASCLMKTVVFLVMLAILAFAWFYLQA